MSILFMDGFDHYNVGTEADHTSKWLSSDADIQAVVGAHGDGQAMYTNNATTAYAVLNDSSDTIIVGFYFYWNSDDSYEEIFYLKEGSSINHVMAAINATTGVVMLRNGAESVTYCSSLGSEMSQDTWYHLEFKFYIHATAGTAELRIDGTTACSATGLDTYASGTGVVNRFEYYGYQHDPRIDHLYILSGDATAPNDFIGPSKIAVLSPAADESPNQFTPTGAGTTNADRVSETLADGDTTYVESSTVGHQELYSVGAMPSNVGTIHGMQVVTTAKKSGATTRTWRNNLTSNVTSVTGATNTAAESYKCGVDVYETDPDTGVAWTESGIEAAKIGFEIVS